MRTESCVTSVSWIPREAVDGVTRLPWDLGIAHYDLPPPDTIEEPAELVAGDAARFANELRGWIEVEGGRITAFGQGGGGTSAPPGWGSPACGSSSPRSPSRSCAPSPRSGTAGSGSSRPPGADQACRPRAAS